MNSRANSVCTRLAVTVAKAMVGNRKNSTIINCIHSNPMTYFVGVNPAFESKNTSRINRGQFTNTKEKMTFAANSFFHSYGRVSQNWRSPTSDSPWMTRTTRKAHEMGTKKSVNPDKKL